MHRCRLHIGGGAHTLWAGSPTLPTAGGSQALRRSETGRSLRGRARGLRASPNLVGALVVKAAAHTNSGDRDLRRHRRDSVVLAARLGDQVLAAESYALDPGAVVPSGGHGDHNLAVTTAIRDADSHSAGPRKVCVSARDRVEVCACLHRCRPHIGAYAHTLWGGGSRWPKRAPASGSAARHFGRQPRPPGPMSAAAGHWPRARVRSRQDPPDC